ncbi:MAG: flagellar biosynthesis protein FlhB [Pseudomonadales bacterium]
MAEEQQGQEKTEEATPRKLEKAKDDGQVARSRELNTVAVVTFGAVALIAIMPGVAGELVNFTTNQIHQAADIRQPLTFYLGEAARVGLSAMAPFAVILFLAGVFSSVAVGGFLLSGKALQPKLERMSVIKGFGRMFSVKSLVELAKSLAKFILISAVAMGVLSAFFSDLLNLGALPVKGAIGEAVYYVAIGFLLIGLVLILIAAVDIPFQVAQHKKQLKMTKQEVKDELKDSDGKPEVKARIRALQQQAAQRKQLDDVPTADVVITNPEHFSVAIRYQSSEMMAPVMVAKGADFMAFRIREIAQSHDIPIVPLPPLARAIFYTTEAGDEIPEGLYLAVAQVLAYVYQLEQYRRGQMNTAPVLADIEVPPEFEQPEGAA